MGRLYKNHIPSKRLIVAGVIRRRGKRAKRRLSFTLAVETTLFFVAFPPGSILFITGLS
jgi:hypothetical protein